MNNYQRRDFLRQAAVLGAAFSILPAGILRASSRLRIGVIGSGAWAMQYLPAALQHPGVEVRAICDLRAAKLAPALDLFRSYGKIQPEIYTGAKDAWQQLLQSKNIDAVLIATPWQQHYKMALYALRAGKHVLCGPVMGATPGEHLDIVAASIHSGKQYITLDENDFDRPLMAVHNMVQQGLFGDVQQVHTGISCAQLHGMHTAALPYALQGSGVAASMLGIGKENPFVSLSVLNDKMEHVIVKQRAKTKQPFLFTKFDRIPVIKATTASGQTLLLQQESERSTPYALGFRLQGSKGQWLESVRSVFLADQQPLQHQWESARPHLEKFDHPAWNTLPGNNTPAPALALQHAIDLLQKGTAAVSAVHAAAGMSMLRPLAAMALREGRQTMEVPSLFTQNSLYV